MGGGRRQTNKFKSLLVHVKKIPEKQKDTSYSTYFRR